MSNNIKYCRKCKVPKLTCEFSPILEGSRALEDYCNVCLNQTTKIYERKLEKEKSENEMYVKKKPQPKNKENKICSKCNIEKQLNNFYSHSRICKECAKQTLKLKNEIKKDQPKIAKVIPTEVEVIKSEVQVNQNEIPTEVIQAEVEVNTVQPKIIEVNPIEIPTEKLKICIKCGIEKLSNDFYKKHSFLDGHSDCDREKKCKKCRNEENYACQKKKRFDKKNVFEKIIFRLKKWFNKIFYGA